MNELWISGAPSRVGGADTELLNNIYLWRKYGIDVHIVPCYGIMDEMKAEMISIGCHFHDHDPSIFKDQIVISYCNGNFLKVLPQIIEKGKPKKVVWFNCMTWLFELEVIAIQNDWIDYHGFVSDYQEGMLTKSIKDRTGKTIKSLKGYKPYFQIKPDMFNDHPPVDEFVLGRVSREDPGKYSSDMWDIFGGVNTGEYNKRIHIMGYNDKVEAKVRKPPKGLSTTLRKINDIPVTEFYHTLHTLIHKTGGSRESYCRIIPECYAHGVPVIVENDYAFPELVINGVTGFRCNNAQDMIESANLLASDESYRHKIIENARLFLMDQIANDEVCIKPWKELLDD